LLFQQHQRRDPGFALRRQSSLVAQKAGLYLLDEPVPTIIQYGSDVPAGKDAT
jgi:hypothetical protein